MALIGARVAILLHRIQHTDDVEVINNAAHDVRIHNEARWSMTVKKATARGRAKTAAPPAKLPPRRLVGRPPVKPSTDDAGAMARLCNLLIGGMSMNDACARDDCPSKTAVYARMAADEAFRSVIARAREAQQHAMIDETIDMATGQPPRTGKWFGYGFGHGNGGQRSLPRRSMARKPRPIPAPLKTRSSC